MRMFRIRYAILLIASMCAANLGATPPAITLTSPSPNAVIAEALTPSVLLQASVAGTDAPIHDVVFYVCMLKNGVCNVEDTTQFSVYAPPYEVQWTPSRVIPQPDGAVPFQAWASATNTLGQQRTTSVTPFSMLQPPGAPTIALVVPKVEGGYVAPTSPVLYATASPGNTIPPSTIARVDFLDGGSVIGTVAAPNSVPTGYAFVWANAPPGMHLVSARATDSLGYSTTTTAVSVYIIGPNPAPVVTLTAPATGQTFAPPNAVPLAATATSPLGTIQRVEFVAADKVISTVFSPPYLGSWVSPPAGNFAVVAKAYDDIGVAATSPAAYIQVLPAPRAPIAVLTAPAPGTTIATGSPLSIAATALAPDGNIGRVDFYAGAAMIGSASVAPFQFTWANPAAGPQSLSAKAYDLQGNVGKSAAVGISVTNNHAPNVAIAAPLSGAQFVAPATIELAATASDIDGSVAKIEFFAGATSVGVVSMTPYVTTWRNAGPGVYALTAVATDNLGATTASAPSTIVVKAPPPTIVLAKPSSGATYAAGQPIAMSAQARAPQRGIGRVEFYSDGSLIKTASISDGPSAIDVDFTWTAAAAGAHVLSAKIVTTDDESATSSAVNILVGDLAVGLVEPLAGQVYQAPGDVRITANPSETGGTIARVDFYGDGVLLGSRTSAPYTFLWSEVSSGTHTVAVTVRDAAALSSSSSTIAISVVASPSLQVETGIDGSSVADDNVSISGTVQAPPNSAVTANGRVVALDQNGRFFVDGILLAPGANTVTLSLMTQQNSPTTKTVNLTSSAAKPFQVSIDRQEGVAPFDVTLTIANRGNVAFQRIEIDTTSDGTPDLTLTSLPDNTRDAIVHINAPGIYPINVNVFDAGNNVIYTTTRRVLAWNPESFARRTIGVYTGMLDRLRRGDVDGALTAVTSLVYDKYKEVFSALRPDMPGIIDQLGTIQHIVVGEEFVRILLDRPSGTGSATFSVELIRGNDGIWRIEGM